MALNFGKGNRSIAFAPTAAFPLNANSYFEDYDLALAAARTAKPAGDTTTKYYFGQEIAVAQMIDNVPQSAKLYIIAPEEVDGEVIGTLQEVGSATDGDGKSIELVEGVLSVKDFGKKFYKYIAATETEEAKYELVEVSEANPWKSGLQPRIDATGSIGWYEPDTSTMEGVQDKVTGIQGDVEQAQKEIDAVEAEVETLTTEVGSVKEEVQDIQEVLNGTEEVEGLVSQVEGLSGDLDDFKTKVYLKTETYNKTEIDGLVSGVFHFKGAKDSFADLPLAIDAKAGDVWQVGEKEYAFNGEDWVELGFTVDLSAYNTSAQVDAKVKVVDDKVVAVSDRVKTLEDANLNSRITELETSEENFEERISTLEDADLDNRVKAIEDADFAGSISALQAKDVEFETTIGNLSDSLDAVDGDLTALENLVGTPLVAVENSTLFSRVEALEKIVPGDLNIIEKIQLNGVDLVPVDKTVNIVIPETPVFSGDISGLVPVAADEVVKETHFLRADGTWAIPMDARIGELIYDTNKYNTVEEYIAAYVEANAIMEWSPISE